MVATGGLLGLAISLAIRGRLGGGSERTGQPPLPTILMSLQGSPGIIRVDDVLCGLEIAQDVQLAAHVLHVLHAIDGLDEIPLLEQLDALGYFRLRSCLPAALHRSPPGGGGHLNCFVRYVPLSSDVSSVALHLAGWRASGVRFFFSAAPCGNHTSVLRTSPNGFLRPVPGSSRRVDVENK